MSPDCKAAIKGERSGGSYNTKCAYVQSAAFFLDFSTLLAICAGNSQVTGELPAQRPVTRSFGVFFDLRLNKRLSKQSWGWWFETLSRPLWRHSNVSANLETIISRALSLLIRFMGPTWGPSGADRTHVGPWTLLSEFMKGNSRGDSISHETSYRKISKSLEVARSVIIEFSNCSAIWHASL